MTREILERIVKAGGVFAVMRRNRGHPQERINRKKIAKERSSKMMPEEEMREEQLEA